jgi:glycosyltransferase involved in cell wall biosynthesis
VWKPDIVQANLYSAEVLVAVAKALAIANGACYLRRLAGTEVGGYRSRVIVRLMDHVFRQTIACSPPVAEAYREFMGVKRKSELVTIPNGGLLQSATTTTDEKRHARQTLGISENAFVVTHIGRMLGRAAGTGLESEPKAQDVLLKAFADAFRRDADCVLVLVGDGPLRPEVEALARSLDIVKQTRLLGEQADPWTALQAADVFCFPSRHEGLPNVLPEAASCGLPVVASNIPEIRNLCPGDAWLLEPVDHVEAFADGLRTVRRHLEVFTSRARNAADQFRSRFSMSTCAAEYLRTYEHALGDE